MLRSHFSRRRLPHIERLDATYFVTICTLNRALLSDRARDIILATIVREHSVTCWLECAVVMPDHLHMVGQPHAEERLPTVLRRIKASPHIG
jgi:REP element-mobilizing transposase RayT